MHTILSVVKSRRFVELAALLLIGLSTAAHAAGAVVFTEGVIRVDRHTAIVYVVVCDATGRCEELVPDNGEGLLRAGLIEEGETVGVKIAYDRGRHRGHVTVLK